jgi:uncharacterized protein
MLAFYVGPGRDLRAGTGTHKTEKGDSPMTATVERIEVPARGGRAVRVASGQRVRLVNVEGGQIGDLWAFVADDVSEYHSAEHTRMAVGRLFPRPGEYFVTNRRRPILLFEEDRSPGVHDMLGAACDAIRYAQLGAQGWHASCQENLQRAMAELGHDHVEIPQPINFFQNIPVAADGTLGFAPSEAKPGDSVTLRAELDCVVVVSSCPQDILPVNDGTVRPLRIELVGSELG